MDSSTDEEEESFADHSRRIKKGLVDGGVNSPATEFHYLLEFACKVRDKMQKGMEGATKEALKEQAGREARAKNIQINGQNVSYMCNNESTGSDKEKTVVRETNMITKYKGSGKLENWKQKCCRFKTLNKNAQKYMGGLAKPTDCPLKWQKHHQSSEFVPARTNSVLLSIFGLHL